MKKAVLFFVFLCLSSGCVNAKSIEFSVVSNAGIQTDTSTKYADTMTPSIKKMLNIVDKINNNDSKFSIFLGDNIATTNKYNLVMFAKIIKKLKKTPYVAIGDRDVSQTGGLDKNEYYRVLNLFCKNKIKEYPYVKKIDGFVFIFVDGVNQFIPTQYGYYKEDMLAQLDVELKKYENDPVVLVGHYPIFSSDEIKESTLPNKIEDFHNILAKHNNVIAIISGHNNIDDEYKTGDIYNISVPSLDKTGEFKKVYIDYTPKAKFTFVKTRVYKSE